MRRKEETRKADRLCLAVIAVCLVILLLCSCRSIQYVPVETVKTNTEYRDRIQRDSIHVKDSVFMFVSGDTVFRDRWHTEYKDRLVRDTVNIADTVKVEVPYPVEKKLTGWQAFKMDVGGIALGAIIVLLAIVGWLVYKRRNK